MKPARLNLELDARSKRILDGLKKSTCAGSLTEVIRRALRLYKAIDAHHAKGGKVFLVDPDGTQREVIVL